LITTAKGIVRTNHTNHIWLSKPTTKY